MVRERSIGMVMRNVQLLQHPPLGSMIKGVWEIKLKHQEVNGRVREEVKGTGKFAAG